jgi:hypothetical protein
MIGENRKLTFEVPYFCSKNKPIRIAADRASTTAGRFNEGLMSSKLLSGRLFHCSFDTISIEILTSTNRRKWSS